MTTDISVTTKPNALAEPSIRKEVRDAMAYFHNKLVDGTESNPHHAGVISEVPTGNDRAILVRASQDLNAVLRPIEMASEEKRTARRIIATMFTGYRYLKDDPEELVAVYVAHCRSLPLFAITCACEEVKTGSERTRRLEINPAFPPSHAQLFQLATECARRAFEDRILAAKALPRPQPTDHEKGVVARYLADLGQRLGMNVSDEKRKAREAGFEIAAKASETAILREYAKAKVEPFRNKNGVLISLSMVRSLGGTIEVRDGKSVIVLPKREEPEPPKD